MNFSLPCNNVSTANGFCHGLPVCGYCYDMGLHRHPSTAYELYNLLIIGILLPLMGTFGIFGNSISAFIYSRKSMKSSINTYLCALAFSDITVITTSFFLFFLESMRKRSSIASRFFALFAPVTFPLGLTAQSMSVFLTIAGAFDCFILVIGSDSIKQRICTPRIAKRVIGFVFILAIIFNLSHWFEIYVIDCWSIPYSEMTYDVCPTALRMSETYIKFYYAYLYTIVMALGPVILLVVINSCIVIFLRSSCSRKSNNNNNSGTSTNSASTTAPESDIITLVLVICLFIACNILPLTINFLELLFSIENTYMIDLSNLMVVLNSSCNFLIYYAFGSQFRRTLKNYLKTFCKRKKTIKFADEIIAIHYSGDSEIIKPEDAFLL